MLYLLYDLYDISITNNMVNSVNINFIFSQILKIKPYEYKTKS